MGAAGGAGMRQSGAEEAQGKPHCSLQLPERRMGVGLCSQPPEAAPPTHPQTSHCGHTPCSHGQPGMYVCQEMQNLPRAGELLSTTVSPAPAWNRTRPGDGRGTWPCAGRRYRALSNQEALGVTPPPAPDDLPGVLAAISVVFAPRSFADQSHHSVRPPDALPGSPRSRTWSRPLPNGARQRPGDDSQSEAGGRALHLPLTNGTAVGGPGAGR
ncbi:uncharacterized protein LOC125703181 [Lagopus muta]|uniref:uncharacterized protein LOC125703181 n=1 Tax=Lagopus muta TaxID=64668 RepID=UPI0020A0A8FA|nr:uncharacterized protein LOC125703181 [Lagopus muta]